MLSGREQRMWQEIARSWEDDAEEPARPWLRAMHRRRRRPRGLADLPAFVVAGAMGAVGLLFLGGLVAGSAVGVATVLGWALWHYWPVLREQGETSSSLGEPVGNGGGGAPERGRAPGHEELRRMSDDG